MTVEMPKSAERKTQQTSLLSFFKKGNKGASSPTAAAAGQVTPASSADRKEAKELKQPTASQTTPTRPQKAIPTPESDASSPGDDNSSPLKRSTRARKDYAESEDEEEGSIVAMRGKRQRRVVQDDDESDFEPPNDDPESDGDDSMDEFIDDDDAEDEPVKPKKRATRSKGDKTGGLSQDSLQSSQSPQPSPVSSSAASLSMFASGIKREKQEKSEKSASPASTPLREPKHAQFQKENEERYSWLVDIRDADGNRPGDKDYDPRTLYIPQSAWAKFTAFEKQYWEVKSKMWSTVVFFKKGKFYELYEPDADIAHSEFDLKLAGGGRANMRLAGVPESSFNYWASAFIAKGYKVARVDQKETALAKEMRDRELAKKEEKVIKRELSYVLTGGTLTDSSMLVDDMSTYCMAIKQQGQQFAIVFVDTATAEFLVSEFTDDSEYSQLETLIAQVRPRELILEKGAIDQMAVRVLKNNTSVETMWNYLKPESEYPDSDRAHEDLVKSKYFEAENLDDLTNYPKVLQEIIQRPLAMSAYGALIWYFKSLKLDQSLVSLGNIQWYNSIQKGQAMVLDGQSLQNLEVFANTFDGTTNGTLFKLLNRCITPFGKRKLKEWVCHPLMDASKINGRLDTVEYLNNNREVKEFIEKKLVTLPDVERMLSRIHAGQIKVQDFVRVVMSYDTIYNFVIGLRKYIDESTECGVLQQLVDSLPHLEECLPGWSNAFDYKKATEDGELVPKKGVEEDFDQSLEGLEAIEKELENKLKEYKKLLKTQDICYRDWGKELYLIEVPARLVKMVPDNWTQMGGTAKAKKYWSPEVRQLVRQLEEGRERHKLVADQVKAKLYARFDQHYSTHWLPTVKVIACIDCLVSLANLSSSLGEPSCRPQIIDQEQGEVQFKELRHPCFNAGVSGRDGTTFIPNDIELGGDNANMTLLTGANAAGKSTVLRMTCVAVIMAQIGCYVPCESAVLTPVDRIMTRLGANDNIFAGKSTFFVELSETKRMLSEATPRSLLVLDELGRGGSSSDGFAIAEAVLHHIATHVGSLGFFATHYRSLANSFESHPQVEPRRMAILVDDETRRVTFLYKLEPGVSPGSFGMHVATMCGIQKTVVDKAEQAAEQFEHTSRMRRLLQFHKGDADVPLGLESDFVWALNTTKPTTSSLEVMFSIIDKL